jgi:DUF1680 family protein
MFKKDLLGGVVVLRGHANRRHPRDWEDGALYRMEPSRRRRGAVTAVPYAVWGNRFPGQEMRVWMRQA